MLTEIWTAGSKCAWNMLIKRGKWLSNSEAPYFSD